MMRNVFLDYVPNHSLFDCLHEISIMPQLLRPQPPFLSRELIKNFSIFMINFYIEIIFFININHQEVFRELDVNITVHRAVERYEFLIK